MLAEVLVWNPESKNYLMACFTACCLISTIFTADQCRKECAVRGRKLPSLEKFFSLNKILSPAALLNVKYDFETSSWIDSDTNERILPFVWETDYPQFYDTLNTRCLSFFIRTIMLWCFWLSYRLTCLVVPIGVLTNLASMVWFPFRQVHAGWKDHSSVRVLDRSLKQGSSK